MLRILEPIFGKSRGPASYVMRTTAFHWTMVVLLILVTFAASRTGPLPFDDSWRGVQIAAAVFVAPLFENFLMIVVIEFVKLFEIRKGDVVAIMVVALIAAVTHGNSTNAFGIGAAVGFGVMAYTYLAWTDLSPTRRYAMTVAQHLLANMPYAVLLALATWT